MAAPPYPGGTAEVAPSPRVGHRTTRPGSPNSPIAGRGGARALLQDVRSAV